MLTTYVDPLEFSFDAGPTCSSAVLCVEKIDNGFFDLGAALVEVLLKPVLREALREGVFDEPLLEKDERAVEALVLVVVVFGLRVVVIAVIDGLLAV